MAAMKIFRMQLYLVLSVPRQLLCPVGDN